MANPVMSSGHSMLVTLFADRCEDEIEKLDPLLDDSGFVDRLYDDQPGIEVRAPSQQTIEPFLGMAFRRS